MLEKLKSIVIALLLVAVPAVSLGAGCALNISPPKDEGLKSIKEAWDIIFRDYVEQDKVDATKLSEAAINAMIEALDDPYTSYMDPETYKMGLSQLEGKFEGIGATVGMRDDAIVVIAPIPGSPAAEAGVMAGDTVVEIDGVPASEYSLEEAILHIRGPKGTSVTLRVLHDGETEPVEIVIVRAEIQLPSVRSEMREDIAYINITYFSDRTDAELISALQNINEQGATGIILDMRTNPGGLLQAVVDVANHFLKEGTVVSVVDNKGETTVSAVEPAEISTDLPMVVLVDSFSASGSEVLAGALQDHKRAVIAGSKTYGKGSVNILQPLNDGSGIYITTARWLTPNGRLIEGMGIEPDIQLELEGEEAIQWAIDYLRKEQALRDFEIVPAMVYG